MSCIVPGVLNPFRMRLSTVRLPAQIQLTLVNGLWYLSENIILQGGREERRLPLFCHSCLQDHKERVSSYVRRIFNDRKQLSGAAAET
jgi:hypothetical protein